MTSRVHRVLLVDDHPALREALAAAMEDDYPSSLKVVGQCGDGVTAVEQAQKVHPDVVVLDLGLPGWNGIRVIGELKKITPPPRCVVFSMHEDQAHVVEAIQAGADDYLFKGASGAKEVAAHLLRWLENEDRSQDRVRSHVFSALREVRRERWARGTPTLTTTELHVLQLAAFKGLSMKEIAKEMRSSHPNLSERTVRKHLENAYTTLGARGQAHAVCLAIKYGIIGADGAVSYSGE